MLNQEVFNVYIIIIVVCTIIKQLLSITIKRIINADKSNHKQKINKSEYKI